MGSLFPESIAKMIVVQGLGSDFLMVDRPSEFQRVTP